MAFKVLFLAALILKAITAQRIVANNYQPSVPITDVIRSQQIPILSAAESDVLCKNFASAIQSVILDNFAQNCYKKPVFNKIAQPLVNDIATTICTCPVCSAVNITPNSYSKNYISPNAVSGIINNANGLANTVSNTVITRSLAAKPNVVNANSINYGDLISLLSGLTRMNGQCGCNNQVVI
ncbi:uncharacterized protein LOC116413770 [Galleria mellonella]|uniref:Uncharacterized protein LOC116413770 n=1 Tax=Galleria mellonella TaxID=7137 RepID=A0A6J3CF55_GALME|nr:uncharacterized protein LOC116413770 [Galleria mellonella]